MSRQPRSGQIPRLPPSASPVARLGRTCPGRIFWCPSSTGSVRSAIATRMFGAQELLVAAKHLTEVEGIDILPDTAGVTYVHLMFGAHEILTSNGAQSESLYPGPQALLALGEAANEIFTLFPELRDGVADFPGARPFVAGKKARQLASRHAANRKPLAG